MDDIARITFFRPFASEARAALGPVARWRDVAAGQAVLNDDDDPREVFFVAEGELRVIVRSSGGHEIILNELGAGSFFGEIAAIDGGTRSAGVVALTRVRVCTVPVDPFIGFVLSTPQAAHHLMRCLAALVREKDARLMELTVLPVRARLVALLLRLSRPRDGGGRIISPPRPHHELAARIGARREAVSRALSALARASLVTSLRGGLLLVRPEALEAELDAAYRAASVG